MDLISLVDFDVTPTYCILHPSTMAKRQHLLRYNVIDVSSVGGPTNAAGLLGLTIPDEKKKRVRKNLAKMKTASNVVVKAKKNKGCVIS